MADLSNLEGISQARNDVYNRLEAGQITEARALGMERLLRGQQSLKADVPIRLLGVVLRGRSSRAEHYALPLIKSLHKFTTGQDMPEPAALPESKG